LEFADVQQLLLVFVVGEQGVEVWCVALEEFLGYMEVVDDVVFDDDEGEFGVVEFGVDESDKGQPAFEMVDRR